jgi:hypothetical protein
MITDQLGRLKLLTYSYYLQSFPLKHAYVSYEDDVIRVVLSLSLSFLYPFFIILIPFHLPLTLDVNKTSFVT